MSYEKRAYGPPRRAVPKPYSLKLEAIENFKNKVISNEYLPTITKHLKTLEQQSSVNPAMIDLQPEVKWFMRPYLVNFIIQMHASLKLKPQTLFLCWNIIDRYCAKRIAFKQHYQLIGCVALWIAAKYEDKKSRVPTVTELSLMCSNVYDESMFKEMEIHILSTLGWSLGHTTVEDVLQLAVKFSDPDGKEKLDKPIDSYRSNSPTVSSILAIGRYLGELSLYERNYLNYDSSLIGVTSYLIACSMLGWDCGSRSIDQIFQQYMISQYRQSLTSHCGILPNGLPTPITPTKASSDHFYSAPSAPASTNRDEFEYDCDSENREPNAQQQSSNEFGPFISGFNGIETIKQLRVLSLMLLRSMLNPPEVLIEKYNQLGVISWVKNFLTENRLTSLNLKDLENVETTFTELSFDISNLLLNFEPTFGFVLQQSRQFAQQTVYQSPIATKSTGTSSPFDSPSNFSSFSSTSSHTTYDSYYEDSPPSATMVTKSGAHPIHQYVHQSTTYPPSSSPLLTSPN